MANRGSVDWLGNIIYSDSDLADMRAESEAKHDRRMEQRLADIERRLAVLESLLMASPSELALTSAHLPYSVAIVAQATRAADERR